LNKKKKISIYTGHGDRGTTSLVGGVRVSKTHPRLEAYGTIDELSSFIGLLLTELEEDRIVKLMQSIQQTLFTLSACLATDTGRTMLKTNSRITQEQIRQLEQGIDELDDELPELKEFIEPGGCRAAAYAHVCRTVCRRAERAMYRINEDSVGNDDATQVDELALIYINRLSDLLFVIARYENFRNHITQNCWQKI
jgi:cob(I)alamin adenosyltransferase